MTAQQTRFRPGLLGKRQLASLPRYLLWLLVVAYAAFFSACSLQRHASFHTYAADLSYFDQPLWNTAHGRFMERTLHDRQVPRMTDHLEPILIPISLLYYLWDDAAMLLVVQSVALALGAVPAYWIARDALARRPGCSQGGAPGAAEPFTAWAALAFALAYLMFPALQAANLADFHADPLIVAPLLCAFHYSVQRRYRLMWAWALVAMLVKENLPSLTFMLGLYLALDEILALVRRHRSAGPGSPPRHLFTPRLRHGLVLMGLSLFWLYVAMFLIVGPIARSFYGSEGPVYLEARYTGLEGGLFGLLKGAVAMLRELARLEYLKGLLAPVGWLALLAPEYLLLGLPVLVANTFSNYPGQFSGAQHYSAPLAPALIVAAAYGARRLSSLAGRLSARGKQFAAVLIPIWLLAWSLGYHAGHGWTPLARDFVWPEVTAHHRLLARFAAQIPPEAALSTTPPLHPHLAHRRVIYTFPIVADADYVLVDVAGVTDMHPNDVHSTLLRLMTSGEFRLVDAADGYILLARGQAPSAGMPELPDAFYDFARAGARAPTYPLDIRFGSQIRLLGYDLVDDPRWRLTRFRFYWQAEGPLPADTAISFQVVTPAGQVVDDTAIRPMPALLWYPPARWAAGEKVVTESIPWYLPLTWAPSLAVATEGRLLTPQLPPDETASRIEVDGRLYLPAWTRRAGRLEPLSGPARSTPLNVTFANTAWSVQLTAFAAPARIAPGQEFPVLLRWQAPGPADRDYTVFLHLRDPDGHLVANGDATPTWFAPRPTSTWHAGPATPFATWDAHTLRLPAEPPPAQAGYQLVVGWYDWQTGERLTVPGPEGNALGNEFVLAQVMVDKSAVPAPDIPCLFAAASCASQEPPPAAQVW